MTQRGLRTLIVALLLVLTHGIAEAHKPSDSYLKLDVDGASISGQWDIALRDLDAAIGLDSNQDNAITWGEVKAKHAEIAAYALPRLALGPAGAPCVPVLGGQLIDHHSDGAYAVLRFTATCPAAPAILDINYQLFFDIDPQHCGLLNLSSQGETRAAIFCADASAQQFPLSGQSKMAQFADYIAHGAHHIWIGYDHILFLITLLLGTSFQTAQVSIRKAMTESAKVITAFTLSHSLTLGLAATGFLRIPVSLAESLIAATIVAAAVNNIRPFLTRRIWLVALFFGLVHGIGFANVLTDLGLPQQSLLAALLAFNIGVEAGQLVIAAVALPLLLLVARRPAVLAHGLVAANGLIAVIGAAWFSDRVFDTGLMPF